MPFISYVDLARWLDSMYQHAVSAFEAYVSKVQNYRARSAVHFKSWCASSSTYNDVFVCDGYRLCRAAKLLMSLGYGNFSAVIQYDLYSLASEFVGQGTSFDLSDFVDSEFSLDLSSFESPNILNSPNLSILPLLAYHKICNDHYRNEKWQPFEPWTCNIDYLRPTDNMDAKSFVYKRFQNFENYYDIIVAEYTGRPATAEEYYENLRKLAVYYNGRIMYENERKGLFPYFTAKHCDYLLADQPDIISDIISNSKVQRKKGCHMNKQIKEWGEGLIKDWLNDEKSPGHKNLHDILSEPLLEELIGYNDIGNFDRVMALMQVMIYREQLYNVVVKEKKKTNRERLLFDGPLFTYSSWSYDDNFSQVDDDVYTFN